MTPFGSNTTDSAERLNCPACERPNAPTRTACLYCGAALPIVDAALQRPTFRRLEEWEAGYTIVCFPHETNQLDLTNASAWLQIPQNLLVLGLNAATPLPLARLATQDEALLACQRLQDFGFDMGFIPDFELALQEAPPQRIRSLKGDESTITVEPIGGNSPFTVQWDDIKLFVTGRLYTKQSNTQERAKGRQEEEIIDSSETGADELVLDVYTEELAKSWRIHATGFDFSCLREAKDLLAANNFARLCEELSACSPEAAWQNSYDEIRPLLSHVWPPAQQSNSRGWQRTRGSSLTRQTITTSSHENQFTRYSRLCYQLALNDEQTATKSNT